MFTKEEILILEKKLGIEETEKRIQFHKNNSKTLNIP